jgi:hypothetical protein
VVSQRAAGHRDQNERGSWRHGDLGPSGRCHLPSFAVGHSPLSGTRMDRELPIPIHPKG